MIVFELPKHALSSASNSRCYFCVSGERNVKPYLSIAERATEPSNVVPRVGGSWSATTVVRIGLFRRFPHCRVSLRPAGLVGR
jgi:hypothetical protein